MKTILDQRLPFTIQIPDGCEVKGNTECPFGKSSDIIVNRQNPSFFFHLTWGRMVDNEDYSTPPGYQLLEKRQIRAKGENITLLIAKGSFFFGPAGFILFATCLFFGTIAGAIGLLGLWAFGQNTSYAIHTGLAIASLLWMLGVMTASPPLKYAFIFQGQEYVFTSGLKYQPEMEKCIQSIMF